LHQANLRSNVTVASV